MRVAGEGAVRVTIQIGRTVLPGREVWFVRNAEATNKKVIDGRIRRRRRIAYIVLRRRHRSETVLPTIGLSFRGRRRILGFSFRRRRVLGRLLIGIVRRRSIGALEMRRIRRRVRRRLVVERMAVILRRR